MPPQIDPARAQTTALNTTRWAVIGAVFVVLAGLGAGILVFANQGSSDGELANQRPEFVVTQAAFDKPVFQPIFVEGDDAFYPLDTQVVAYQEETNELVTDAAIASGLYGGTVEETCDADRLIRYLYENPAKGEAWAASQDIPFNELASYIRSLEARVLAAPAVVVNNGFDATTGTPIPIETTLDAGTAVLVDANGDIRVRCYCGNPVQPRTAMYRPERCVVTPSLVLAAPGGLDRRVNVPATVQISGQIAAAGDEEWTAVVWGTTEAETGWTPTANLVNGCLPDQDPGIRCAAAGTPVWDAPSEATQLGQIGGQVRTSNATKQIDGNVAPVGGASGALEDRGFTLVKFTRAAPATNGSAWIPTDALADDRCGGAPATTCAALNGPVTDKAGGIPVRSTGTAKVTFTGHFSGTANSHAEVALADGARGWISNDYTPTDDSECPDDEAPAGATVQCAAGGLLYGSPTTETMSAVPAGHVKNAPVYALETDEAAQMTQVQLGPQGPTAWLATSALGPAGSCAPLRLCANLQRTSSLVPEGGAPLPGTPGSVLTDVYDIVWIDAAGSDLISIGVDGHRGWTPSRPSLGECTNDISPPPAPTPVLVDTTPTPEPTPTPTPTPRPTPTPAPAPTSAPVQPAPTPVPAEPTPTPTPSPEPTPACPDADGDGICNAEDNCRDLANVDQDDADSDGQGDACDTCTDADLDLHCAETDDSCPDDYDPSLLDTENDGVGDVCDNCPFTTNPDQADSDGNGIGNRCDTITDPVTPNPGGGGGGGYVNPCPAGQEEDLPGTGRCYPRCSLGAMTSGGFCCPRSFVDQNEIDILGCVPICGRTLVADNNPATRSCIPDPRDPSGAIYDVNCPLINGVSC